MNNFKALGRQAALIKLGVKMSDDGFSASEAKQVAKSLGLSSSKEKFTPKALQQGLNIELEHKGLTGGQPKATGHIALDHLKEDPEYYTKLKKMEG